PLTSAGEWIDSSNVPMCSFSRSHAGQQGKKVHLWQDDPLAGGCKLPSQPLVYPWSISKLCIRSCCGLAGNGWLLGKRRRETAAFSRCRKGTQAVDNRPPGGARESNRPLRIERQIAAGRQLGNAVDQGPGRPGQRLRVTRRQVARLLSGHDAAEQHSKGILADAGFGAAAIPPSRGQIEHHQKVIRPA